VREYLHRKRVISSVIEVKQADFKKLDCENALNGLFYIPGTDLKFLIFKNAVAITPANGIGTQNANWLKDIYVSKTIRLADSIDLIELGSSNISSSHPDQLNHLGFYSPPLAA
jgi:hypothetical protein